ncbi:McrC family protein [Propioniciclava tarda]|uniref:Restriction endonuclease n=1 Tax=Propioniciclava tarda TaxID=433330 RepID=A0A4Q9KMZ9_PROTD|nr:restriction endonuclease [Propioniciclava tarda]TBT95918.1 restriction endonuclease [Propioniciclava tarda]SMO41446.1 5-methylcytosine-specific restriction enzyme subunit McrC [Propioniciclava tarda]
MANPLILREGDGPRLVELRRPVADALAAAGTVQLGLTDRPGWWEVSAGTQIGVVSVDGLQVVIQPKIGIKRLVFLMGYARHPTFWRDDRVLLDSDADLPEALADAFVRLARRALEQGLLKGYVTVDETLAVLRGRVREADQLRRRWGRSIPLEVRYDEFTVDIAENQLLLAAVEQLLRTPRVGVRHRAGLQRLRLQLADVTAPGRGGVRPSWVASRLNAKYVPALELAELVLAGRSFEQRVGDLVVSGYLFNMATIFEDFVTVVLREAFRPFGGRSRLQYRTHLDEAETVPVRPDFVWLDTGLPRVVVDAKYKAEKPSGFPQADLYQLLAYCTVLGLPVGHLIYAKGFEDAREHAVRHAGVRIVAHTLDLQAEPASLLRSVSGLVDEMRPTVDPAAPAGRQGRVPS